MSVALALMAVGSLVGGLSGNNAAQKRASEAAMQAGYAKDYLDSVKKRNIAQRNVLVGNLSMAALSTNAQNRNTAMEVEAANDAQRNAIGSSGLSGGTPFYKLDQDIRDRQMAVVEQNMANRLKMGTVYDEAIASMAGMALDEKKATYQYLTADAESKYSSSFMGMAMPTISGAMQGASTASSLMSMGVQSSLLTEDFLASGFGDLFKSKAADTASDAFDPGNYSRNLTADTTFDLYDPGNYSRSFTQIPVMGKTLYDRLPPFILTEQKLPGFSQPFGGRPSWALGALAP
jgi:hypothetical protein